MLKGKNVLLGVTASISAYKAQEIRDICHTLNINAMKTPTKYKTKKDLYQLICETIM